MDGQIYVVATSYNLSKQVNVLFVRRKQIPILTSNVQISRGITTFTRKTAIMRYTL